MRDMRAVIIDDNLDRREQIRKSMPDYVETVLCGYGEAAIKEIVPDAESRVPDLVIMNGEDSKGMGLYMFDWMRNKSGSFDVEKIPCVILVEDEFSDRSMEFLEIDDVVFYEGEVEDDRIYSVMMEALTLSEFAAEEPEPAFTDDKSFDKAIGMTFKPLGGDGAKKRSVVLNMDEKLMNLEAALARGREKTESIRKMLESTMDYKESNKAGRSNKSIPHVLNKIRLEHGLEEIVTSVPSENETGRPTGNMSDSYRNEGSVMDNSQVMIGSGEHRSLHDFVNDVDEDELPEEFRLKKNSSNAGNDISTAMNNLRRKVRENPGIVEATHSGNKAKPVFNGAKKTIVVIDDDEKDRKTCEMFLGAKYNVVLIDSGMKAIDYFVRNTADLILMDTYMPNLGGVQTLASIRWQAKGRNVPVIYMFDKRYPVARESLVDNAVIGVVQKPLSPGSLAVTIDSYFRKQR